MAMAMASIAATNDNDEGGTAPRIRTACDLSFHGAAASSRPHSLLWVRAPAPVPRGDADASPDASPAPVALADTVVYASSGVINLATSYDCLSNDVTSVDATLVTRTRDHSASSDPADGRAAANKRSLARGEAAEDAAAARSITALAWVDGGGSGDDEAGADGGGGGGERDGGFFGIVAAFSDGTVTSWRHDDRRRGWTERVLVGHDPRSPAARRRRLEDGLEPSDLQESVADVSAANVDDERGSSWMVATASSKGVFLHLSRVVPTENNEAEESTVSRTIDRHAAASVRFQRRPKVGSGGSSGDGETTNDECYLFAGSASPRHNKVWVYTIPIANDAGSDATSPPLWTIGDPICHGHLLGHQDWVTCFAWLNRFDSDDSQNKGERKESLLASSGHDAKIRLWKFSSWPSSAKDGNIPELEVEGETGDEGSDDEDEAMIDDLEEEEGEARLVINTAPSGGAGGITSAVSLEALLLGHEEAVTSLAWRRPGEGRAPLLLSSSMDRTILLWMEEDPSPEEGGGGAAGGVWVPVSRVGSAGGILGGSVGASLMGFVDAAFSPGADRIAGHGYGGSLHFWTREGSSEGRAGTVGNEAEKAAEEDALATARWVADPCITGHFRPVVDMAWDPDGDYLLTVSSDQTTRLWTEVPVTSEAQCRWVEVGRPQVHGYDMTSIVCIGGTSDGGDANISERGEPRHRFVSGADEKTLRVFDAPASTLRTIYSIKRSRSLSPSEGGSSKNGPASWIGADAVFGHRVERAYLPSLGLSNKATADADQENSKYAGPVSNDDEFADTVVEHAKSVALKLLSERDLGVTTLWPETRKLFGHESELVCLDAYRAPPPTGATGVETTTLVASSCKARNDVASAAIRLWDSKKGKCVGILKVSAVL